MGILWAHTGAIGCIELISNLHAYHKFTWQGVLYYLWCKDSVLSMCVVFGIFDDNY